MVNRRPISRVGAIGKTEPYNSWGNGSAFGETYQETVLEVIIAFLAS